MMLQVQDDFPGLGDFIGVAGTQGNQARDRPQAAQVLNGLVGRTIFADANGIVREDVNDRDFHQRRQADGRTRKVREDKESAAIGPDLGQCHAIKAGAHGEFADAEVEITAGVGERLGAVLVDSPAVLAEIAKGIAVLVAGRAQAR